MAQLEVRKRVQSQNDRIAAENRDRFAREGRFAVNMMGSPGAGKTTLLEHLLPKLLRNAKTAVIEGDLATDNDARRVAATGAGAVQINTNGGCHLDARMIAKRLDEPAIADARVLIIENVGNLVCPAGFDLGEDLRLVVLSITEGEDKPEKYPVAFLRAGAVALTKADLAPYVRASVEAVRGNILRVNPKARVFVCRLDGDAYDDGGLADYLLERAKDKQK